MSKELPAKGEQKGEQRVFIVLSQVKSLSRLNVAFGQQMKKYFFLSSTAHVATCEWLTTEVVKDINVPDRRCNVL